MSGAETGLGGWLARRILGGAAVVLGVVALVWACFEIAGVDRCSVLRTGEETDAQYAAMRELFGCDLPAATRFVHQMGQALTLDFGVSRNLHGPVRDVVLTRLLSTLALTTPSLILGVVAGFIVASVSMGDRPGARLLRTAGAVIWGIPPVFLALIFMVAALRLHWPPTCRPSGGILPAEPREMVLPILTLALTIAAGHARYFREILRGELGQPYVLALRARGLDDTTIWRRHVLRNALGPILALLSLDLPWVFGGAIVVEKLYNWQGIGGLLANAAVNRDGAVVTACTMVFTTAVVVGGVAGRVAQALVDPRVRA